MTEQIKDVESKSPAKRGRPKAAPTKVTTVNLIPAMKQLPNGEKVKRIQDWIDTVDVNLLIKNALTVMMRYAESPKLWSYVPVKFQYSANAEYDSTGNLFEDSMVRDSFWNDAYSESSSPIRLPKTLYDQVIIAADKLATTPSDVIKLAIAGMYLDSGAAFVAEDNVWTAPNFRRLPRKNSTVRRREDRVSLQRQLSSESDPVKIARLEQQIAEIKV